MNFSTLSKRQIEKRRNTQGITRANTIESTKLSQFRNLDQFRGCLTGVLWSKIKWIRYY